MSINNSRYIKAKRVAIIKVAVLTAFLITIFFPQYRQDTATGGNYYAVNVDGRFIGYTDSEDKVYDCYREARRDMSEASDQIVYADYPEITLSGNKVSFGRIDSDRVLCEGFKQSLEAETISELKRAYAVKVNETIVYLEDAEALNEMLQGAVDKYDDKKQFKVDIISDANRELPTLTVSVNSVNDKPSDNGGVYIACAGAANIMNFGAEDLEYTGEVSFDSFELGVKDIGFRENVEIAKAYVPESYISNVSEAASILTENQEVQQIYKVQSGDTLSEISLTVGLPLDDIIAMNDELENENSLIRVDQELIITVPKPELSVEWTALSRVDEAYDLPIEYIYNDDWYTNQSVTHVQPSAGYHEAIVLTSNLNEEEETKETVYEEIKMAPVAKVVEIGTKIPPTYIKPISGGRFTSGFGRRNAPTKGASSYHKGIDWATPVGTSVYASSGGTVAFAGWGRGYGNVVYINHPDGRQTRYGHLSRIYVSVGESVRQGQVIAASGNTGVSTGPHVHFEILINGSQVNPFDYMY